MTPGYWMNERTGRLRPAIMAYVLGAPMTDEHVAALRAYLRQWIASPLWGGGKEVAELRQAVDGLTTRTAISAWLDRALEAGIDPL